MKTHAAGSIALLLAGVLAAGCGGGKASTPGMSGTAAASYAGPYPYEKGAVRIHLKADPRLNLFDATPHALLLCVYSLRDPNGFNQMLDEPEGMSKLLECSRFDPSVTNTKKISIQPRGEVAELLDRPEGAKYVGLVAGYANLRKENSVRLYAVPIIEERIGLSIRKKARPGKLEVDLYLGPESVQEVR